MKNKILLLLSLVLIASAANLSADAQIKSGAYAGVGAGMSVLGGKNQFTYSNDSFTRGTQVVQDQGNFSLSNISLAASVFAGYGAKINSFWLAGEVFYQYDKLKDSQNVIFATGTPQNLQSSSTGAYGTAIHVGFVPVDRFVAYAILGVEARSFSVKFSNPVTGNNSAVTSKKYTSIAFAPGLGARFTLSEKISIRGEYKYAFHPLKTITASAKNTTTATQTDITTIKHQPRVQSLSIGVVYTF